MTSFISKETQSYKSKKAAFKAKQNGNWNYHLLMCFSRDWSVPVFGTFCCLCGNSTIASQLNEKHSEMANNLCCCILMPCVQARTSFRNVHHIPGECCDDCFVGICCAPCSYCQLQNELDDINDQHQQDPKKQVMS